jgi:hypothetical protein
LRLTPVDQTRKSGFIIPSDGSEVPPSPCEHKRRREKRTKRNGEPKQETHESVPFNSIRTNLAPPDAPKPPQRGIRLHDRDTSNSTAQTSLHPARMKEEINKKWRNCTGTNLSPGMKQLLPQTRTRTTSTPSNTMKAERQKEAKERDQNTSPLFVTCSFRHVLLIETCDFTHASRTTRSFQ